MRQFKKLGVVMAMMLLSGSFPSHLAANHSPAPGMGEPPCPLCGQPWRGRSDLEVMIPKKLPAPKNQEWLSKLRRVLVMAKFARAQYEADQKKFGITNPYRYIIPQLNHHIDLINKLFTAYGLPADGQPAAVHPHSTVLPALENGKKLEEDSATQYEWLLNHAEDKITRKVLNYILTQTKLHCLMFDNVIRLFKIEGSMAPLLL